MPPRPKENVWNYPRPPALQHTSARLRVIWVTPSKQELVVAETTQGYRVLETSHPPTYYFPPNSVRSDLIKPSKARRTMCEWKGMAAYHDLQFSEQQGPVVLGRIWSYPDPTPSFRSIKDYLCFYATSKTDAERLGKWKCMVDDDEVVAQEGDFYGSWITPEITGGDRGFKGGDTATPSRNDLNMTAPSSTEASTSSGPRNPIAAYKALNFAETLEDLSSRFIVNLPSEELASIERICFQVEQAHWFYEDFLRPLNSSLPSLGLRKFSTYLLHASATAVPLIQRYITGGGQQDLEAAFDDFLKYKTRVPVCGAIILSQDWNKCLLVKGWKSSASWGFPKGKINQDEPQRECAIREVVEETGYDCSSLLPVDSEDYLDLTMREQKIRLYIVPGVSDQTHFETQTRKEISKIAWFRIGDLPTWKKNKEPPPGMGGKFYLISPFIGRLKQWIHANKHTHPNRPKGSSAAPAVGSSSPAPVKATASAPTPAFPDTSSFFPSFPANAGDKAAQQKAAPLPAPPSSEKLKALLGLSTGAPEPAVIPVAPQPQPDPFQGVGSNMIEQSGDPRGKELLDLLRGPGGPAIPPSSQPSQAGEAEKRAASLLAALNGGPPPAPMQQQQQQQSPQPQSQTVPPAQQQSQQQQALLNLFNSQPGSSPLQRQAPPPSESPLPAPRPQKTIQAQKLLQMITPGGGPGHQRDLSESGSVASHQNSPVTQQQQQQPSPLQQNQQNLLASILGGAPSAPAKTSPSSTDQQAKTLLQMLSPPRQQEPPIFQSPPAPQHQQQQPLPAHYFGPPPSGMPPQAGSMDLARLMQAVSSARDGSPSAARGPSQNDLLAILTGALGQQQQQGGVPHPPPPHMHPGNGPGYGTGPPPPPPHGYMPPPPPPNWPFGGIPPYSNGPQ